MNGLWHYSQPIVDPELSDRTVLWRYLDTAKFFHLLHTEALFLCRGDRFDDKFEGSFTPSWRAAIKDAYEKHHLPGGYDEFRRRLRSTVFINCWHRNPHDSMAMWSLYGRSETAVAITTTVGQLRQALQYVGQGQIFIDKVTYTNHWKDPQISITPYCKVFAHKVQGYAFEREVRVILDLYSDEQTYLDQPPGISVRAPLLTLLRSVVLSPSAPKWFDEMIRSEMDRRGFGKVPVRNSKLSSTPL
ncbi:hypothetical protein [Zestomonas carbonaria]|uniref:DUF2971 domain-containing protein n=1 Tax=Zestomonas carbonaria TaxID=2762745 RepID=A0A7U7EM75_9GAMM|nr:hypothetical protein [Pseudomonas carbonaria]CAD5107218.1 hypothetical protein PSEWESI4_01489 [Pseudomonas carbonaria]